MYGNQVQMTYKGQTHIKSSYGGMITLMNYGVLIWFIYSQFLDLYFIASNKQRLLSSTDVISTPSNFNLTQTDMELAARLTGLKDPELIGNHFKPIFGYEMNSFEGGQWIITENRETGVPCTNDGFVLT
jgi:hypothetical protein